MNNNIDLTPQQQARISHNFRIAKERLARKRNHSDSFDRGSNNHKLGNETESGSKRVPLSTIANNLISPVPLKLPNKNYLNACESNSVVTDCSWSRSVIDKESGIKRVPLATVSTNQISPVPINFPSKNNVNGGEMNNVPKDFSWSMPGVDKESGIKRVPLSAISTNPISPVPPSFPKKNNVNGCEMSNVPTDFSRSTSGIDKESGIKRVPFSTISTNQISPVPLSFPNKNNVNGGEMNNLPMDRSWSRSGNGTEGGIKRTPLSNITNSPMSPVPLNLSYKNGDCGSGSFVTPVRQAKCSTTPCLSDVSGISAVKKLSHPSEEIYDVDSCITSSRQQHDSLSQLGSSSYPSSMGPLMCLASAVINDDFDDTFLDEIDAICEQHSAIKSEKENSEVKKTNNESVLEYGGEENTITNLDLEEKNITCGEISEPVGDQFCDVKNVGKSDDAQYKGMPDEYAKYIQSLNDRQQEAACGDISVPLVIIAGPGSGKTSTMVGRVLMLLYKGIGPSNILAMTFTTAAAAEMRERIASVAGKATAKELTISTFHSFSLQLCRLHAEKLGRTTEFLIYGHGQQRKAIIEAVRLLEDGKRKANHEPSNLTELSDINSPKHFKDQSKKWLKFVTQAKAAGRSPEYFRRRGNETGASILQNYSDILKSCNALDYYDFISCSLQLLTDFPEVFQECQESWKAIVIDEFQDTSSMQYGLLKILASHKRITIVGDEDQSIFGFNGADASGFDSFRKDFSACKEVRLDRNYRSTRCIVEAASFLIKNNLKRCTSKDATTDKSYGSKITVKECFNEDAQCSFVVDKILAMTSDGSSDKCSYGQTAVLYRRQVTGKMFQTAFRSRNIPFNMHGVAFYRKKVVRAIIAMLSTPLPGCDDVSFRRVFKALLPLDKEEKKKVIDHIDKVSTIRRCSFVTAARDIFSAKISGTFKRTQLTQGHKVLLTLDMISKLVQREQSISAVITSVANMIPQKYLLEQRAVLDVDGGKLLNEDNDIRSVLQYLLDDLSLFLTTKFKNVAEGDNNNCVTEGKGCMNTLKEFIDYISLRERENFRTRKHDNEDSVTLTTIHQSKGLEWDTVFIVKTNEAEIPLLHEFNGTVSETSVEEERRLLYVAMTRARKKLFMLYLLMDPNWQVLQPSRFLREIPHHLLETQEELMSASEKAKHLRMKQNPQVSDSLKTESSETNAFQQVCHDNSLDEVSEKPGEVTEYSNENNFLKRFSTDDRAVVSHLFHQWAKKPAFHDPKRLLSKVGFAIDERLRAKKCTHKDVLRDLKSCLTSEECLQFAISVLKWEQLPAEKRAYVMREKQEHFQKLRIENAMGSSEATPKQIAYLQSLGCTTIPSSRLHASRLIEEYKSL